MTDQSQISEEFKQYTERMLKIRLLSSPNIRGFDDADSYSERLRNNFREIGRLAQENRDTLERILYPRLRSDSSISEDIADKMSGLVENLISLAGERDDFENLDAPIAALISDRLLKDAEESGDIVDVIHRMDEQMPVCYAIMSMTARISSYLQTGNLFRDKGIKMGERFITMLDKETFMTIPEEERGIVLLNARFMTVFFEGSNDKEHNRKNIEILDKMLEISEDPFYLNAVPDYNWKYFKFRTLEYYYQCTEICNARGFSRAQLVHIAEKTDLLDTLCESDRTYFETIPGYGFIRVQMLRCRFLAGMISREQYREMLVNVYINRDKYDYQIEGGYNNILVPIEFLCIIDRENYSADEAFLIKDIYRGLSAYLFHTPSNGYVFLMMDYFFEFIKHYIDVPGGTSFEQFVLECFAAMHPPTYIHSCMVGQVSLRIAKHVIRKRPELFIGMPGCNDIDSVKRNRDRIENFVYHSGLCHDFGKICIIDTIFVYGRNLLDFEFGIIKAHPDIGAELLKRHYATAEYADVALGHHKWYDDSKGYPVDFNIADSPYKTAINIVQCADCMDAATDTVGRSYSRGKNLRQFIEELKEGAGTRYVPWLYELFEDDEVYRDIDYMLTAGREWNYRETFKLLKDVEERG